MPFGIGVSALPQAAPAVQKPQAADTQAPVTAEQVRAAIDKVHAKPDATLAGAREIAFFPPVTGG